MFRQAHTLKKLILKTYNSKKIIDGKKAYAQSKLANILFTIELSKKLEGTNVTVNSLHPGGVATNFSRNNGMYTIG